MMLLTVLASGDLLAAQSPTTGPTTAPAKPTRAQINALIAEAGRTPPDWWDSVPLNYPKSLDLSWRDAGGAWNPQLNVGQYLWDIIHPNPRRWREGVKFVHHVLSSNRNNPDAIKKGVNALSHLYSDMLQDYARGAFWSQKANNPVRLANCYWKLGSKEMAVAELRKLGADRTRNGEVIKLWADMGEHAMALRLAEAKARTDFADAAYLAAGDACRLAGDYAAAVDYYRRVLSLQQGGRDLDMNKKRAQANLDGVQVFDALDLSRVPDGKYSSSSLGYNGQVHVQVSVAAGRISDVQVTRHEEKQFYASIQDTTSQIIAKQGVKGVDATSGATITSEAIINATAKALSGAMK